MVRKRWTPQTHADESVFVLREKRKWQIALRRYVLERHKSTFYAPYFGLDHTKFREWIETQFDEDLSWDNFSENWQFDHIVPLAYFDFTREEDLRLCWSFINIRVAKTDQVNSKETKTDVLTAKAYFEELFRSTGYQRCHEMVEKIRRIEEAQLKNILPASSFIQQNKAYLEGVDSFISEDFERLNSGTELKTLLYEKEFLKKFGS